MALEEVVPGQCRIEYGDAADQYLRRIKSAIVSNLLIVLISAAIALLVAGVLWAASKMLRGALGEWMRMRRSPKAALLGAAAALEEGMGDDVDAAGEEEDATLLPETSIMRERVRQLKDLHRPYNTALEEHVQARGGDPSQGIVDERILSRQHDDFDYSRA